MMDDNDDDTTTLFLVWFAIFASEGRSGRESTFDG